MTFREMVIALGTDLVSVVFIGGVTLAIRHYQGFEVAVIALMAFGMIRINELVSIAKTIKSSKTE
jgi:hypothetical protein